MRSLLHLLKRRVLHLMHWTLLLVVLLLPAIGQATSKQILVVLSENTTPYAVFSTPQQSGQALAEMIQSLLPGKSWKPVPSAYPKYFTIQTNANVARSLKISLPEKVLSGQALAPRTGW